MMKRYTFITLLLVLLVSPLFAVAAKQIRAKPVLKHDKEYNAILIHVAQYFVLTIPEGKTVDDIGHDIRCTFVIATNGALHDLVIENNTSTIGGLFESGTFTNNSRTVIWLREAVLKGMSYVPSFNMSQIRSHKSSKKRTIVFSFGRGGAGSANASFVGFNTNAMNANLNQTIEQYQKDIREGKSFGETPGQGMTQNEVGRRYLHQDKSWVGFTDENIKSTIKPTYKPHRQSLPVIKTRPKLPMPSDSLPGIQIAISLQ